MDPAGEYYENYYGVYFEDPDRLEFEGTWYGKVRHDRLAARLRNDSRLMMMSVPCPRIAIGGTLARDDRVQTAALKKTRALRNGS